MLHSYASNRYSLRRAAKKIINEVCKYFNIVVAALVLLAALAFYSDTRGALATYGVLWTLINYRGHNSHLCSYLLQPKS